MFSETENSSCLTSGGLGSFALCGCISVICLLKQTKGRCVRVRACVCVIKNLVTSDNCQNKVPWLMVSLGAQYLAPAGVLLTSSGGLMDTHSSSSDMVHYWRGCHALSLSDWVCGSSLFNVKTSF